MGARGNSGVILSQILRGLARGLEKKDTFDATDLAVALEWASKMAYSGISNPVEGTVLTVIKDVAAAAQVQVSSDGDDILSVMEASSCAISLALRLFLLAIRQDLKSTMCSSGFSPQPASSPAALHGSSTISASSGG